MLKYRYFRFVIFAFCIVEPVYAHDCPSTGAVVEKFFREDYNFAFKKPTTSATPLTQKFESLLNKNFDCKSHGDSCNIDFDPWTGAQDGNVLGKPTISTIITGQKKSRINILLRFQFDPAKNAKIIRAAVILKRKNIHSCWRVDDFKSGAFGSVSELLSK